MITFIPFARFRRVNLSQYISNKENGLSLDVAKEIRDIAPHEVEYEWIIGGRNGVPKVEGGLDEVEEWLFNNTSGYWVLWVNRFYFKNIDDAVLFKLKWVGVACSPE